MVYSKYPELKDLDLTKSRVQKLSNFDVQSLPERMQSVIYEIPWKTPKPVKLEMVSSNDISSKKEEVNEVHEIKDKKRHYFVGGLEALFACLRQLEKNQNDECVYVNDGEPLIAQRAGLQLHEHPTQFPDYDLFHLFAKTLESIHLKKPEDPEKWDYSPLHMNLSNGFQDPLSLIKTYGGFLLNKLWWEFTSKNRVSVDDQDLVNIIRQSIANLKRIDEDIRKVTGKSIMNQNGRLYWSIDKKLIEGKERHWKAMNIDCELISREEINAMTLLNANDHNIYALRMKNDGEMHPDVLPITLEYLKKKYPDRFKFRITNMVQINFDKETKQPISVIEEDNSGEKRLVHLNSIYASLGHNNILMPNSNKKLYDLVPVSGATSDWKVRIPKKVLQERLQPALQKTGLTLEEYIERDLLVPSADMFNLHVKTLDHQFENDDVILYVRATEGAIVLSHVANKHDLVNIAYKLNKYFVGDWEIMTAGSCTRKTAIRNRPEIEGPFRFGQSGIGISLSAADYDKNSFTRK